MVILFKEMIIVYIEDNIILSIINYNDRQCDPSG